MFKTIKGTFKANGKNDKYTIVIERVKSGANEYGDLSAHIIQINDEEMLFDTRYEWIPIKKDKWTKFWTDYLLNNYTFKDLTLESYEEEYQ